MASGDFTKIGAGSLFVLVDADNQSSPNVMFKNSGLDRVWYQNDTIGNVVDSWVKSSAKLTDGGSGVPALWFGLRQAGNLDASDGYQILIAPTALTLYRVVSSVRTVLINNLGIALPAGAGAWNDHRFSVATDGSTSVRLRFETATPGGAFSEIFDFEDVDAARITAAGKVRFGAEELSSAVHTIRIDDFDGGTLV